MQTFDSWDCARLISAHEWESIIANVPNVPIEHSFGWWVNGDKLNEPKSITPEGTVYQVRNYKDHLLAVRPMFMFGGFSAAGLHPGDKILIKQTPCTVVAVFRSSRNIPEVRALADVAVKYAEPYTDLEDRLADEEWLEDVLEKEYLQRLRWSHKRGGQNGTS